LSFRNGLAPGVWLQIFCYQSFASFGVAGSRLELAPPVNREKGGANREETKRQCQPNGKGNASPNARRNTNQLRGLRAATKENRS
jgi:hypothetical protein